MRLEQLTSEINKTAQNSLQTHLSRLSWSREKMQEYRTQRLRQILQLAVEKSPWYRQQFESIDINRFELSDLHSLPILDKQLVLSHWDDIVAEPELDKSVAEAHLEKLRSGAITNPYYDDKFLFLATGGSSGKRGLFVRDKDFVAQAGCIIYRTLIQKEKAAGYKGPMRLATLEAPTLLHGSQHIFNVKVVEEMQVTSLNTQHSLEQQCQILNKFKPTYLVGYASSIAQLARAQLQGKLSISPRWISTNSEPLDEVMRQKIKAAWGIDACNSWGSVEIACVAMETQSNLGMVLSEDAVILERVDAACNPVADDHPASMVLVTSLIANTMPIIRYVIDDALELSATECEYPAFSYIKSVKGRASDWFNYGNIKIHPMTFRHTLSLVKEVNEYQVIQTKSGVMINLVCEQPPDLNSISAQITEGLKQQGLKQPKVTCKIMESLPKHYETGKIKRFVPIA